MWLHWDESCRTATGLTTMFFSESGVDGASYVSFPSGSLPDADSIEVRNLTLGIGVGAPVLDGGLDPLSIPASPGDSLRITVLAHDQTLRTYARIVPDRHPPIVVRTDPPPGRTRVPLNAQLVVIFSEPMDPGTIGPDVIQLMRNGLHVPGTVTLEPNGWEARFTPAENLDSLADYQLTVSTDATGLGGGRLEEPVAVPFGTGTELMAANRIARTVFPTLYRGQTEILGLAYPSDDAGRLVLDAPVHWSSTDSTVVQVDSTRVGVSRMTSAWLTARSVGTAGLIVAAGAVVDTVRVTVAALQSFISIEAGEVASCALDSAGQAYCWGHYLRTMLGHDRAQPVPGTIPDR